MLSVPRRLALSLGLIARLPQAHAVQITGRDIGVELTLGDTRVPLTYDGAQDLAIRLQAALREARVRRAKLELAAKYRATADTLQGPEADGLRRMAAAAEAAAFRDGTVQ